MPLLRFRFNELCRSRLVRSSGNERRPVGTGQPTGRGSSSCPQAWSVALPSLDLGTGCSPWGWGSGGIEPRGRVRGQAHDLDGRIPCDAQRLDGQQVLSVVRHDESRAGFAGAGNYRVVVGIAGYEIDGYSLAPCGHRGRTQLGGPTSARSPPSSPSSPRSIRSPPTATRDPLGVRGPCGSPAPALPVRTSSVVPWLHPFQEMEPPEKPAAVHNRNKAYSTTEHRGACERSSRGIGTPVLRSPRG
jgi:hypothetical protein